jgi:hypothetical protein
MPEISGGACIERCEYELARGLSGGPHFRDFELVAQSQLKKHLSIVYEMELRSRYAIVPRTKHIRAYRMRYTEEAHLHTPSFFVRRTFLGSVSSRAKGGPGRRPQWPRIGCEPD